MKIRDGFVSNSSSSSFLIGIAKVIDLKKTAEIIDNDYDFELVKVESENDKKIDSFTYDEVSCDCKIGDYVIQLCNLNDEGDYHFDPDSTGDFDYDVDYDDCTSPQVEEILEKLNEAGCVGSFEMAYGAGRNG